MFDRLKNLAPRSVPPKSETMKREVTTQSPLPPRNTGEPKPTYAKVFHWRLPARPTAEPKTVEIIGSFTDWQRVPLLRKEGRDSWKATLQEIAGHRTHHYMLLVDGLPAPDKNCDGLAIPHGPQERQ